MTISLKMFCDYGYSPEIFKATGIFPGDLECYSVNDHPEFFIREDALQGKCLEAHSMTKNESLERHIYNNRRKKLSREIENQNHLI